MDIIYMIDEAGIGFNMWIEKKKKKFTKKGKNYSDVDTRLFFLRMIEEPS